MQITNLMLSIFKIIIKNELEKKLQKKLFQQSNIMKL